MAKKHGGSPGKLSYGERKKLPDRDFAIPSERRYPIENVAHGRNALARVAAYGTDREQEEVRRAVHDRYPSIDSDRDGPDGAGSNRRAR
jgi:hypothetical protein